MSLWGVFVLKRCIFVVEDGRGRSGGCDGIGAGVHQEREKVEQTAPTEKRGEKAGARQRPVRSQRWKETGPTRNARVQQYQAVNISDAIQTEKKQYNTN